MKLALLGDIHGNHYALRSVLESAKNLGVQRLLITGDLIGYYFWPKEVLRLLEPWSISVVCGNHEAMLSKATKDEEFLQTVDTKYGTGLRIALSELGTDQITWLKNLPHPLEINAEGRRILLCHGSPWDIDKYIYSNSKQNVFEKLESTEYDWVVLGHTHYPMVKKLGNKTIINPGSVGQTRNRRPGAYWALFDTESGNISCLCEPYDVDPVVTQSKRRHPDIPYLADVLLRS